MEYNPLDKANLGISVRDALLKQPTIPMEPWPDKFEGAGIYAIYYTGDFSAYAKISMENRGGKFNQPIYVGKAVPSGSRKGGVSDSASRPTRSLYTRLTEHAKSISETKNLRIEDFYFRYLTVDDIWIPLGETYLIERFRPLWNKVVEGFGIHTPGERRKGQYSSMWDTLHPGRVFVTKLKLPANPKGVVHILDEINSFLSLSPPEQSKIPDTPEI
jgi:hypothetical protein